MLPPDPSGSGFCEVVKFAEYAPVDGPYFWRKSTSWPGAAPNG